MGDVLISEYVIPYEAVRVQPDRRLTRAPQPPSNPVLFDVFRPLEKSWGYKRSDGKEVVMRPGPLLSGEKLIDDLEFKTDLFLEYPEAIGGEMEAAGVAGASDQIQTQTPWIVVKAVSDWGGRNEGR